MCMISKQGMNCGRSDCCYGNFHFCICQVWIYNSEIIRLQWMGVLNIPLTHLVEAIPSYVPPYQLPAPTPDPQQVPTPGWGNIGLLFCLSFSESPLNFFLILSTYRSASSGLQAGSDLAYVALFNEFISTCLATLICSLAIPVAFSLILSQLQSYGPILCCEEPGYLLYGNFYWTQPVPGTLLWRLEQSNLFSKHLCPHFPRQIHCAETFFL